MKRTYVLTVRGPAQAARAEAERRGLKVRDTYVWRLRTSALVVEGEREDLVKWTEDPEKTKALGFTDGSLLTFTEL